MLRPYLLFYGNNDRTTGGVNDFKGDFNSLEDAIRATKGSECDWAHVALASDLSVIAEGYYLYSESIEIDWKIK